MTRKTQHATTEYISEQYYLLYKGGMFVLLTPHCGGMEQGIGINQSVIGGREPNPKGKIQSSYLDI